MLNYCTMFPAYYQAYIWTSCVSAVRLSSSGAPSQKTSKQVEDGLSQISNSDKSWWLDCRCSYSTWTEGVDIWKLLNACFLLKTFLGVVMPARLSSLYLFFSQELVLYYFSAHWCPPCRRFTPMLAEFYKVSNSQFRADMEQWTLNTWPILNN